MTRDEPADSVRLDKWLWAARFYKTRSLATEAVAGGKVSVNGDRAKPAKLLKPGGEGRPRSRTRCTTRPRRAESNASGSLPSSRSPRPGWSTRRRDGPRKRIA